MKHAFLAVLILFSSNAQAAKLVSERGLQYLPVFGLGSTSSVAFTGASGESFVWNATGGGGTVLLRIFTTQAAYIAHGTNPDATSADPILPANTEMILEIPSGEKISAAAVSTGGTLYTSELLTYSNLD